MMVYRLVLVFALTLMPIVAVVHAQETARDSLGDVGVSLSPLFTGDIELGQHCCFSPGVWVTLGQGRFRLQVDHVYARRKELYYYEFDYPGTPPDEYQGRDVYVERARLELQTEQATSALMYWRLSQTSHVSPHVLLGLTYWNIAERDCEVAEGAPVNLINPDRRRPRRQLLSGLTPSQFPFPYSDEEVWFRVDLTNEEEQQCFNEPPRKWGGVLPQVGGGFDIPIGSRFLFRAQARLFFFEIRVGTSFRF